MKVETEEIAKVLRAEVLKREVLEGEKADLARRLVGKAANRTLRAARPNDSAQEAVDAIIESTAVVESSEPKDS